MILSGDFFYIVNLAQDNGRINALLEINPNHRIFDGHFPGQPVVPGICMMQMMKEVLESAISDKVRLASADNIKFLRAIVPGENNFFQAEIISVHGENGNIKVSATLKNEGVTYFKMNGIFVIEEK